MGKIKDFLGGKKEMAKKQEEIKQEQETTKKEEIVVTPIATTKKEELKEKYSLRSIATQTSEVIVDNETETPLTIEQSLVQILNDTKEILYLLK
jgi:hypothetical protein